MSNRREKHKKKISGKAVICVTLSLVIGVGAGWLTWKYKDQTEKTVSTETPGRSRTIAPRRIHSTAGSLKRIRIRLLPVHRHYIRTAFTVLCLCDVPIIPEKRLVVKDFC